MSNQQEQINELTEKVKEQERRFLNLIETLTHNINLEFYGMKDEKKLKKNLNEK